MKKTLLGIAIGLTLMITGVSYASSITFGTGGQVAQATGGTSSFGVPKGGMFNYAGFAANSSTCGGNALRFAQLKASGTSMYRTDLQWDDVQATSSASYIWGGFDCVVNDANALGIGTLLIIDYAPGWAAHSGCTGPGNCAPASSSEFGTFCGAAASHFNGRVTYWEVWNEHNSAGSWGPAANTTEYIAALNACYSAIKAVNPSMQVISGGLEPTLTIGGNISMTSFVTAYYSGGATFDIMGIHPYTYPWGLTKGDATSNGWQAMIAVRQTMNANGDSAKPIWITEVGAPTCGTGLALSLDNDSSSSHDYMTMTAQRQIIDQIIATSSSAWTNIGKVFFYTIKDINSNDPSTRENCFGALFSSGNAKPLWTSIRNN